MWARMKQAYIYFFKKFTKQQKMEVKNFLSKEEYNIFLQMEEYDQVHSYSLWKKMQKMKLEDKELYYKLALLHDCGKERKKFFKRCCTVLFDQNRKWDKHSEKSFQKLEKINPKLAVLCLQHHQKPQTQDMRIFQMLDDQ